jgi:hypothetical protein
LCTDGCSFACSNEGEIEMPFAHMFVRSLIGAFAVVSFTVGGMAPASAKICKDGAVHYAPGALSKNKAQAKRTALESWRKTYSHNVQGLVLPKSKDVKCVEADRGSGWRCFVKAAACVAS